MSWTYSGDPASSDLDTVRYLVQDTNVRDQLAMNEDIAYELSQSGNVLVTAVAISETILADMVRRDREAKTTEAYRIVVNRLRRRVAAGTSGYAGGTSKSKKVVQEDDSDRVLAVFRA